MIKPSKPYSICASSQPEFTRRQASSYHGNFGHYNLLYILVGDKLIDFSICFSSQNRIHTRRKHCENHIALRKLVAGILRGAAGAAHSSPQAPKKRANSLYRSNEQL